MNTRKAIRYLTKQLEKDEGYRQGWQANIAMAYKDNWNWYKVKTGKKVMNAQDRHIIANNAADYFLKLLCDQSRYSKQPLPRIIRLLLRPVAWCWNMLRYYSWVETNGFSRSRKLYDFSKDWKP